MHIRTTLLIVLITCTIGSLCDDTTVTTVVRIPVEQWQKIDGEMAKSANNMKLLLVSQHDAAEVKKLKEIVDSVSDPDSVEYGNFMSYDQIYQSILPTTIEHGGKLEDWAKENGMNVTTTTKNKEFLAVEASPDTIERVFQTKLNKYQHKKTGQTVLRGTDFKLPLDIHRRLAFIGGLSTFPIIQKKKRMAYQAAQLSTNAPIIYVIATGFSQYAFYIQLVCSNGEKASNSLCTNQFRGFEMKLSGKSRTFTVPATKANCQICSEASILIAGYCNELNLSGDAVFCQFYFLDNDAVPLYEPHTFNIRTKFLNSYSDYATFPYAVEKGIDITPPVLRSLYNVYASPNEKRDKRSRQSIVGFLGEYLDLKSFNYFAGVYGKEYKLLFGKAYGNDFNNPSDDETETSLDTQYMASMGFGIPMDYISPPFQYDGFLIDFFFELAEIEQDNQANVIPLVYSISYAVPEVDAGADYVSYCEESFMLMSLTGKTVFASSGDTGSSYPDNVCRTEFYPSYPASSAYVTSVGATQFVKATANCRRRLNEQCLEEVVASKSYLTGCLITSGGGFSSFISSPEYQHQAVDTYLRRAEEQLPPETYFNRSNRAYPDISLAGHQYLIKVLGNNDEFVDGTSASSPSLAGLISLIVDQRLKLGKKPLGLLNPLLYSLTNKYPAVFHDITKGSTNCNESPTCCQYGFVAEKQWDPASGLGSINHIMLTASLIKK